MLTFDEKKLDSLNTIFGYSSPPLVSSEKEDDLTYYYAIINIEAIAYIV